MGLGGRTRGETAAGSVGPAAPAAGGRGRCGAQARRRPAATPEARAADIRRAEPAPDLIRGRHARRARCLRASLRSEEHTSELQSLMRISYAVFCLKKKKIQQNVPLKNQ